MAEVIENPILNSPYREPARHHLDRISGTIVEGGGPRRFVSVARTVARGHHRIGSLCP